MSLFWNEERKKLLEGENPFNILRLKYMYVDFQGQTIPFHKKRRAY